MIFLVLSVCTSALLFIIFKIFDRLNIHSFTAIVINYAVAFLVGFAISPSPNIKETALQPWFLSTLLLGLLFITLFNVIAIVTQRFGVTTTVVANKMALVIPVLLAFIFLRESPTTIKITGILLALIGIYLTVSRSEKKINFREISLPLLLFFGSGVIDFTLKLNQLYYLKDGEFLWFVSLIFLFAFVFGLLYGISFKKLKLSKKNIIAGLLLGIPNYFSIYFLLEALNISSIESSIIFPINNTGILLLSSILSVLFFSERLSAKNWIGMICCACAIILVSLSFG